MNVRNVVLVAVLATVGFGARAVADSKTPAEAGERVGAEGPFVRMAANDEGYVVVSYRTANDAVGHEWMLLDVGMTVLKGVEPQKITRDDIKLVTPDHKILPVLTQEEYKKAQGALIAWERRANLTQDSINYFPPGVIDPCRIEFFANPGGRRADRADDEVELASTRACVGRLFFRVPGNIQYGNYNLDVVLANSVVKVPMEIMTEDREKEFTRKWKEAQKESKHEDHEH